MTDGDVFTHVGSGIDGHIGEGETLFLRSCARAEYERSGKIRKECGKSQKRVVIHYGFAMEVRMNSSEQIKRPWHCC